MKTKNSLGLDKKGLIYITAAQLSEPLNLIDKVITGATNKDGMDFLSNFGKHITQSSDEYRESVFLFQRLSVLIQRYNAVAVLGTFTHTTPEDEMLPFQQLF